MQKNNESQVKKCANYLTMSVHLVNFVVPIQLETNSHEYFYSLFAKINELKIQPIGIAVFSNQCPWFRESKYFV